MRGKSIPSANRKRGSRASARHSSIQALLRAPVVLVVGALLEGVGVHEERGQPQGGEQQPLLAFQEPAAVGEVVRLRVAVRKLPAPRAVLRAPSHPPPHSGQSTQPLERPAFGLVEVPRLLLHATLSKSDNRRGKERPVGPLGWSSGPEAAALCTARCSERVAKGIEVHGLIRDASISISEAQVGEQASSYKAGWMFPAA